MSDQLCLPEFGGVAGCGHTLPCPWHGTKAEPWVKSSDGERVMDAVEASTPPEWRAKAETAIETVARRGQPFTADDVWQYMGEVATRRLGPIMVALAKAGKIKQVGKTGDLARKESHGQSVSIWAVDGEWT